MIVVRHGESVWNGGRRFQGQSDPELSARGLAQAGRVAERLRADIDRRAEQGRRGGPLAALYTSPLRCAAGTAEGIGRAVGLPPRPERDLQEMALGEWEGRTPIEIRERWGDLYPRWRQDPAGNVPPGGETMEAFGARMGAAVDRLRAAHSPGDIVIVSHSGAIGAYLCRMLGLSLSSLFRFKLENGSLTEVLLDGIGDRLVLLNDTSHLRDAAPLGAPGR